MEPKDTAMYQKLMSAQLCPTTAVGNEETAIDVILKLFQQKKNPTTKRHGQMKKNFISKNGYIKIKDFLLNLLNGNRYNHVLRWVKNSDATFFICNPVKLSQMWGITKGSDKMNYEKMTRAIRYGYGTDFQKGDNKYEFKFIIWIETEINEWI